jgi:hypothetical protein
MGPALVEPGGVTADDPGGAPDAGAGDDEGVDGEPMNGPLDPPLPPEPAGVPEGDGLLLPQAPSIDVIRTVATATPDRRVVRRDAAVPERLA